MKVTQLISKTSGNPIKNQFVINKNGCTFFQSYETVIAKIGRNGKVTLDTNWDYSNTTIKYLGQFLGDNKKSVTEKIKNKIYSVKPLNV